MIWVVFVALIWDRGWGYLAGWPGQKLPLKMNRAGIRASVKLNDGTFIAAIKRMNDFLLSRGLLPRLEAIFAGRSKNPALTSGR